MSLTLHKATERALEVREQFAVYEEKLHGRTWTTQEIMLGFLGDVGDLAKLVQGASGVRKFVDLDDKLAHEFADCLWSILVLAKRLDVDIESAFVQTMNELELILREKNEQL